MNKISIPLLSVDPNNIYLNSKEKQETSGEAHVSDQNN
jgi:hypothetical protein